MSAADSFQFVTVGTTPELILNLWDPIAVGSPFHFSHIVHPRFDRASWIETSSLSRKYFISDGVRIGLPEADRAFLLSLEDEGVPTVHNMILSDRVASLLPYEEALRYATLLAKRLMELLGSVAPNAVIGGFDALHGSLGLAVAMKMKIPWYALHFSTIPQGLACFCDRATPAARVQLKGASPGYAEALAEKTLRQFESREIVAPAYLPPTPRTVADHGRKIGGRLSTLARMLRSGPARGLSRFTDPPSKHSIVSAGLRISRAVSARNAAAKHARLDEPPSRPYVLFGLHMQPESSIDVWAPFFSNQMWVVELLSRSIPPTHQLLVKIHKSDTVKHSNAELTRIAAYPGVELVAPLADTRRLIENADLIVLIQGTIGLEAALIGKPVIMLGQSPFALFPSVAQIGKLTELPALVRRKIAEAPPPRTAILESFIEYLRPFAPASSNDWTTVREAAEIADYRRLFTRLAEHVAENCPDPRDSGRGVF